MSKFLRIIESNIPSEDKSSKLNMISTLVSLIDTLPGIDVSTVDHNTFIINVNGNDITVDVRDIEGNVNEQISFDPAYNLDQAVTNIAAKAKYKGPGSSALGITSAQKANAAVKRRDNVVQKAIPVYDKITKDLERAISTSLKSTMPTPSVI